MIFYPDHFSSGSFWYFSKDEISQLRFFSTWDSWIKNDPYQDLFGSRMIQIKNDPDQRWSRSKLIMITNYPDQKWSGSRAAIGGVEDRDTPKFSNLDRRGILSVTRTWQDSKGTCCKLSSSACSLLTSMGALKSLLWGGRFGVSSR